MFSLPNSWHGFERGGLELRKRSVEAPPFQHGKDCLDTVHRVTPLSLFADLSLQNLELAFPTSADRWICPDQIFDDQQSFHPLDNKMLSTDWFFCPVISDAADGKPIQHSGKPTEARQDQTGPELDRAESREGISIGLS